VRSSARFAWHCSRRWFEQLSNAGLAWHTDGIQMDVWRLVVSACVPPALHVHSCSSSTRQCSAAGITDSELVNLGM